MDNEAEITNSFVFPSDGLNALLIGQSYSIISFYYKNLETDFSRKVNTPGLLDVGIMNDIKERIISILTKDPCEIEIFDTEFIQPQVVQMIKSHFLNILLRRMAV